MKRLAFHHHVGLIILCLVVLLTVARVTFRRDIRETRLNKALQGKDGIGIAVVWAESGDGFFRGARMAADEINDSGGIRGRSIRLGEYREKSEKDSSKIVEKIAKDEEIVAVVGHSYPDIADKIAVLYEENALLFLSTAFTAVSFCEHRFDFVLRTIPSDAQFANELARRAYENHLDKVAILHVRSAYGRSSALAFNAMCAEVDVKIVLCKSYHPKQVDFRPVIADLLKSDVDAILILDKPPRAAHLIQQIRQFGIGKPIVGGTGLDTPLFFGVAGNSAEGTYVATVFHPEYDASPMREFSKKYQERFGSGPSMDAAQAYEAVRLIAQAMERCGSASPLAVSYTLKYAGPWDSLDGDCTFSRDGNIEGKEIFLKVVRGGEFVLCE